jgi:hypothetical protein
MCVALLSACTARNPAYRLRSAVPDAAEEEPPLPDAGIVAEPSPAPDAAPPGDVSDPLPDSSQPDAAAPHDLTPPLDLAPPPPDRPAPGPDLSPDRPPPITSGLVARWRLDPGPGSAAPDEIGNNAGALMGGALWSSTVVPANQFDDRGAAQLDGVDDSVELGVTSLPAMEHAMSISLWFWIASTPSATRQNVMVLSNPGRSLSVQLGIESGKLAVWGWNRAIGNATIYATGTVAAGWHHVGYTFDGRTRTLYLHGSVAGTSTEAMGTAPVTNAILGAWDPASDQKERFKGLVNDLRVYDRALTAKEISGLAAGAP